MTYETAHFRKRTAGSRVLRRILAKFNRDPARGDSTDIGPPYTGSEDLAPYTPYIESMRQSILDSSMALPTANEILSTLDASTSWPSPHGFIEAIAAFSAKFSAEVQRKTHVGGKSLRRLLYNATTAPRVQWLLNAQRLRLLLPPTARALLPTGTTANEAIHAEINRCFRTAGGNVISGVILHGEALLVICRCYVELMKVTQSTSSIIRRRINRCWI